MPRAGLSPEVIADEAARLVDEVGRDRLTLSAVAKRFNVAQPSLYKHVDGMDGLDRLLAVRVLLELGDTLRRAVTGLAGGHAIHALAGAYRRYALAHPGRYAYVLGAPAAGDHAWEAAAADVVSVIDDVFAGYGITGPDAVDAARFLRSVLHGFVSLELANGFGMAQSVDDSFDRIVAATDETLRALSTSAPAPSEREDPSRAVPAGQSAT